MRRSHLFFIFLLAIFMVISGCDKNNDDGDTFITNNNSSSHHDKTVLRNIQASSGAGIGIPETFSHLISYNNKFVAFISGYATDNAAYQLYTVTSQPIIDKPTNYLIGGQGEDTGSIRLFRISPNNKWIVWLDNDATNLWPVNTSWTLKSRELNPDTGAPVGDPIVLQTFDPVNTGLAPDDFRISPDSKWVAFSYGARPVTNQFDLLLVPIDGPTNSGVVVHPTQITNAAVQTDYNFTADSHFLVFRTDGNATAVGAFGLYSYRVHNYPNVPTAWSGTGSGNYVQLVAPPDPANGFIGVTRFKTTGNHVVFTADRTHLVTHNVELFSCPVDPQHVDVDDPIQLNPDLTLANTHVQADFDIAHDDRVIFRANLSDLPLGAFNVYGLYSARIDHDGIALPWIDFEIQAGGGIAGHGVNIPLLGGGSTPIAQVAFRLNHDKSEVVFISNLRIPVPDDATHQIFDIFSHSVTPGHGVTSHLTPDMPLTITGPNAANWGVRDFQVSDDHDYVVLIGSLNYPTHLPADDIIYELYRARVGVDATGVDQNTYRAENLLHDPLIPNCFVYVFHVLHDFAYFVGTLADPTQTIYNGYYVDLDTVPGIPHQITDFDYLSPVGDVDVQPRTLEKYVFAGIINPIPGGVYGRYISDCYPPSGDGGLLFTTYTGDQLATNNDGEFYLYIGFGPKGKKAPLMNDWSTQILALLMFMGIAILVSRKVCRA